MFYKFSMIFKTNNLKLISITENRNFPAGASVSLVPAGKYFANELYCFKEDL